jgi:hypothetical protein
MSAPVKPWDTFDPLVSVNRADKLLVVDVSDTTEGPSGTVKVAEIDDVGSVFQQEIDAAAAQVALATTQANNAQSSANAAAGSAAAAAEIVNISQVQTFTNPLARAIAVQMTAAASGSNGIQQLNNTNLNMGTNDFTLHWEGSLPDWTPSAIAYLNYKISSSIGFIFSVETTGHLRVRINATNYLSTVVTGLADGSVAKVTAVVIRESASTAGSVVFYVNGVQLGAAVSITAGSPATTTQAINSYVCGDVSVRNVSSTQASRLFNRALTAAEVLDLSINGPALSERGAGQTPVYVSDFSAGADGWVPNAGNSVAGNVDGINGQDDWASLTRGALTGQLNARKSVTIPAGSKRTLIRLFNPSGSEITHVRIAISADITGPVSATVVATPQNTQVDAVLNFESIANADIAVLPCDSAGNAASVTSGQVIYFKSVVHLKTGLVSELLASNAQSNTGQIIDTSGNRNHALLPASGATVVGANPARSRQVRSRHQWTATNELQYLTGVNQEVLPPSAAIEFIDIFSDASVSVNIGNGTTATQYASAASLVAGWNRVTLASAYSGTTTATRKLTITPTASATAILNVIVTYHASEVEM